MATETVQQTVTRLDAFITESNPFADTAPGSTVSELVVKLAAQAQNSLNNQIDTLNQGSAIAVVEASAVDTYSEVMDNVASNFNTTRYEGKYSTGKIKVTISTRFSGRIRSGCIFTQAGIGLNYVTTQDWNVIFAVTSNSVDYLQLYANVDGTFYFIIPVQAEQVGSEYQVVNGAQFSVSTSSPVTISNFVLATAYGSFLTGLPRDTDKQLVAKIQSNLTNKSIVSPRSINALLRDTFPTFQTASVIGALDAEMLRSKRNVMGISTFGKADVYVRTSLGPELTTITLEGTKTAASTWSLKVTNDVLPGFYTIQSILPTPINGAVQAGTLVINSTTFSYAQDPGTRVNEVTNNFDSRFTRYQEVTVTFNYTEAPTISIGAKLNFDVTFQYQPNIGDIQDIFVGDETRIVTADYLVKAVVPCFVSLKISLVKQYSTDTADTIGVTNIKRDIFNYINTIKFGESLNASRIVDICHNYPVKRVDLPIQMNGSIFCQDNTTISITDSDILTIPTEIDKGVSPRTTLYFIDYYRQQGNTVINPIDNIGISLI